MEDFKLHPEEVRFWEQVFITARHKGCTVAGCVANANAALRERRKVLPRRTPEDGSPHCQMVVKEGGEKKGDSLCQSHNSGVNTAF